VRGFLRQRLDLALRFEEADPSDALAVELDNLERWKIGDRLLRDRLAGADEEASKQAEWRRGVLPPGRLGATTLFELLAEVEPLVTKTVELRAPEARNVDVVVGLGAGRELRGTVTGLHDACLVSIGYSRLAAGPRLRAWILLVALTAAHPETPWTAATIGRGRSLSPQQSSLGPIDPALARTVLNQLVDLHDRALVEPLPLSLKTSAAYAETRVRDEPPEAIRQATKRWRSDQFPGEDADVAHLQVWGTAAPLDVLLRDGPAADEQWSGEPTRFGELARRLWTPLLEHEQLAPL